MAPKGTVSKHRYKVVVLGAPSAGKTALVRRLADGSFVEGARQRGLDFYTCQIALRDDVAVTLQMWDLSDCPSRPEDDHTPLYAYIFNSQAVLFVYDVSCPSSLEDLRHALRAVEAVNHDAGGARPYLALVASKCDLRWLASEPLARELAARHGCVRFALSAKTGQGVSQAVVQLACDLAGVPLAATDYNSRWRAAGDPPIGPDEALLASQDLQGQQGAREQLEQLLGASPGPAAAPADFGGPQPQERQPEVGAARAAVGPEARQGFSTEGRLHARAPAYKAAACQEAAAEGSSRAGMDQEVDVAGSAGSVDGQSWRPVSWKAMQQSCKAMLLSKRGPLGQRVQVQGRCQSPDAAAAERGGGGGSAAMATVAASSGGGPGVAWSHAEGQQQLAAVVAAAGEPRRAKRRPWRMLCCCGRWQQ